ncbi:MAG: hypothetical protein RL653_2049 [Pseudomonadota bacterium]|jgi:AcrR family transcriptional regulator
MARTPGARNHDYAEQRLALARKVRDGVMAGSGVRSSLREMAAAAGTSVTTLRHYFGDREGVLHAVMESARLDFSPYLVRGTTILTGDVKGSLLQYLAGFQIAWSRFGVGRLQAFSLAAGLSEQKLGPSYVEQQLEPLLQTAELLLQRHVERGELAPLDTRAAALQLLSPVVLALFHQDSLGGSNCRPLDVPAFVRAHVEMFLRAYPPTPQGPRKRGRATA